MYHNLCIYAQNPSFIFKRYTFVDQDISTQPLHNKMLHIKTLKVNRRFYSLPKTLGFNKVYLCYIFSQNQLTPLFVDTLCFV